MASTKSKINFNKIRNTKDKLKAKLKKDNPKKDKKKKDKKSKNKRKIWYWILSIITGGAILVFLLLIFFAIYIVVKAPEFSEDKLYNKDSTILYKANGEELATLGMSVGDGDVEKRIKLEYDQLPQVFIDAVVATEDSRFFQHNGVDLARFIKASIGQVLGQDGAGGASTLTMQVSKNALTDTVSTGIDGIIRKFTDVYLSVFKIEKHYTKQEILEMYVNSEFLGNGSFGVEQASQTYFGKSATDLTLPEAALIAGLFQAPSAYDPYTFPDKARARRNQVLNLMLRHGYITEEECEIAKSMPITEMLVPASSSQNKYQSYIDTVIDEVETKYNVSPYKVPLKIYTNFDESKQNVINSIYDGTYGYEFKDEKINLAIAVVDNKTGALVAVGAGRNRTGERQMNYATQVTAHPGSTIKPILDYGPAIEYLNWSTYTPLFDEEYQYAGGSIKNWNGKYSGLVTAKTGLSKSMNTCALQAFQATTNEQKWEFANNLGIEPGNSEGHINDSAAIGAFEGATPVKIASAYSAFANGGNYIEAYTVNKIEYIESGDVVEHNNERKRVMKETTAYMITNILFNVTPSVAKVSGTEVATKTGTSSWDDAAVKANGINNRDIIRDSWVATYNPDYTIAFWYGYDYLMKEYYQTQSQATPQRNKIQSFLTKNIMNTGSKFSVPKGIKSVTVELETIPAKLPSAYTPDSLKETHLFISGTEPTEVSTRFSGLENPTNLTVVETGNRANLTWTGASLPSAVDTTYLMDYFTKGYSQWSQKYYDKRIEYNNAHIGSFGYDIYLKSGSNLTYVGFTNETNFTINNTSGYDAVVVKSAYSIFKNNASSGVESTLTGSSTTFEIELLGVEDGNKEIFVNPSYTVGDVIADIGLSTIKFVVGGVDMTDSISSADKQYVIRECSNTCKTVTKIDNTVKGEYEIVYTINYLGTPYKKTRYVHVKEKITND